MDDPTPAGDPWDGLMESLPVGVTISYFPTDNPADGYLVAVNQAANEILGFDLTAFIGVAATPEDLGGAFDTEAASLASKLSFEVAIGGATRVIDDFELQYGPGMGRYEATVFPLPGRRAASVFRSVDREAASNEALAWAMETLESANLGLSNFASTVAHDLKNPLSGIAGNAELVKMTTPDMGPEATAALDRVIELANTSATMIDELLQFAKEPVVEAGDHVDVAACVRWVLSLLEDQIRGKGAAVEVRGAATVVANRAALQQVFLNLMTNALQYRRRDVPLAVQMDIESSAGRTTIHVADNGRGIATDMRDRVFEWGVRGETSGAAPSGSGLGLAASRAALASLGGSIRIEGSEGPGTVFVVELPTAG